jgi:hypothetical protein
MIPRVIVSEAAAAVIEQLRERHGALMFHQSGGCCDGSAPMCFVVGEFLLGDTDVWIGKIHDCDFYMSQDQFEYWQHTQLEIDVTRGRGASFSLEIPLGLRFVIKSRIFQYEELAQLAPTRIATHV